MMSKILEKSVYLMGRVPDPLVSPLSRIFATLFYIGFFGERKTLAIDNIKGALCVDHLEAKSIYKKFLTHTFKTIFETASLPKRDRNYFLKMEILGEDYLKDVISFGKGGVLVSAHLGNFMLISKRFEISGYDLTYILRNPENKDLANFMDRFRKSVGIKFLTDKPKTRCALLCAKLLKNNKFIFLMQDIYVRKRDGILVDFFGKKTTAPKSFIFFSKLNSSPIVPIFSVRSKNGHKIYIEEPIYDPDTDSIQKVQYIIEKYVKRYPDQWWWFHKRWRDKVSS